MKIGLKAFSLAALMIGSALLAQKLHPDALLADTKPDLKLEDVVPAGFGNWIADPQSNVAVVDPVTALKLKSIYTTTLNRTFVNRVTGDRMMLSIAYVKKHSDEGSVHYPNVCYPAQGFDLSDQHVSLVRFGGYALNANRMFASMGPRSEPVTYWVTIGDKITNTGWQAKLAQLKYGFKGYVADGLLFRVSSLTSDAKQGWSAQDEFLSDFLGALPPAARERFIGKT